MAAIAALLLSSGAGAHVCTGNCNGDGTVAINELITCVSISLGATPLLNCEDRTPEECIQRGGTNLGPGDCNPDPCNP